MRQTIDLPYFKRQNIMEKELKRVKASIKKKIEDEEREHQRAHQKVFGVGGDNFIAGDNIIHMGERERIIKDMELHHII